MSQILHDDRANQRRSDLKAVFFDLFETLITEKTRKDFQDKGSVS